MAATIDLLRQDHRNLVKLLAILEGQVVRFEDGGQADFDLVRSILDYFLGYPDLCHHPKEDLVVRKLRERDPGAVEAIGDLEEKHRELATVTRRFAAALHQLLQGTERPEEWFGDSAKNFLDSYRCHIDMEETSLFPVALMTLTDGDWAEIDEEIEVMTDPLFGGRVEESYKVLRNEILMMEKLVP